MNDNFADKVLMEDYCQYQQRIITHSLLEVKDQPVLRGIDRLITFIGLRAFWRKTFYGLSLQVAQLRHNGRQIEALNLILDGLSHRPFFRDHTTKWWCLMRIAVEIAQDYLQLNTLSEVSEPLRETLRALQKLSVTSPQPWQGYNVAYSFASFSFWSFQQGKSQRAIEQINIALHADPSWGYPEYLLGWYGLMLEGIDPVLHFVRAIHTNGPYFQQLKEDPLLCQHFPEIIEAVKKQISRFPTR